MRSIIRSMIDPFEGYKIYGPYLHSKEKRRIVAIVGPVDRTSMSYARYLMCMHLGRRLEDWEEVDHIDNDKLNDTIENLQILTKRQNKDKHTATLNGRTMMELVCPWCNKTFYKERRLVVHTKRVYPPTCSRSCSGNYQAYMEGRPTKTPKPD